jgi:hypothetical protein
MAIGYLGFFESKTHPRDVPPPPTPLLLSSYHISGSDGDDDGDDETLVAPIIIVIDNNNNCVVNRKFVATGENNTERYVAILTIQNNATGDGSIFDNVIYFDTFVLYSTSTRKVQ